MRLTVFFLLFIFASVSFAVGWEEISSEDLEKRGISVFSEFNQSMGCYEFKVSLPKKLLFTELGEREFWSARYKVVLNKSRGWQLMSKGTQVILPFASENQIVKIKALCISNTDLETAYLSAVYGGPQGAPPMLILLNLGAYK